MFWGNMPRELARKADPSFFPLDLQQMLPRLPSYKEFLKLPEAEQDRLWSTVVEPTIRRFADDLAYERYEFQPEQLVDVPLSPLLPGSTCACCDNGKMAMTAVGLVARGDLVSKDMKPQAMSLTAFASGSEERQEAVRDVLTWAAQEIETTTGSRTRTADLKATDRGDGTSDLEYRCPDCGAPLPRPIEEDQLLLDAADPEWLQRHVFDLPPVQGVTIPVQVAAGWRHVDAYEVQAPDPEDLEDAMAAMAHSFAESTWRNHGLDPRAPSKPLPSQTDREKRRWKMNREQVQRAWKREQMGPTSPRAPPKPWQQPTRRIREMLERSRDLNQHLKMAPMLSQPGAVDRLIDVFIADGDVPFRLAGFERTVPRPPHFIGANVDGHFAVLSVVAFSKRLQQYLLHLPRSCPCSPPLALERTVLNAA